MACEILTTPEDVTWEGETNLVVNPDNTLSKSGGVNGSYDAFATSVETGSPDECFFAEFHVNAYLYSIDWHLLFEDESGDNQYGLHFNTFGLFNFGVVRNVQDGVVDPDNSFFSFLFKPPYNPGGGFFRLCFLSDGLIHLQHAANGTPGSYQTAVFADAWSFSVPAGTYHLKAVLSKVTGDCPVVKVYSAAAPVIDGFQVGVGLAASLAVEDPPPFLGFGVSVELSAELSVGEQSLPYCAHTLTLTETLKGELTLREGRARVGD